MLQQRVQKYHWIFHVLYSDPSKRYELFSGDLGIVLTDPWLFVIQTVGWQKVQLLLKEPNAWGNWKIQMKVENIGKKQQCNPLFILLCTKSLLLSSWITKVADWGQARNAWIITSTLRFFLLRPLTFHESPSWQSQVKYSCIYVLVNCPQREWFHVIIFDHG